MYIEKLFPVGVLVHDIDPKLADHVEKVVVKKLKDLPRPDANAPHATDYFEPNKIIDLHVHDLNDLYREICRGIDMYQSQSNMRSVQTRTSSFNTPDIHALSWWTQDYIEGDVHKEHDHGVGSISGIYWVRANENAGGLQFRNPNPLVQYQSQHDTNAEFSWQEYVYQPVKGRMLMYPSYLKHEVLQSGKDTIRTTIAFNT